eukprot:566594-Prorocentrum_minimum.AAC.2
MVGCPVAACDWLLRFGRYRCASRDWLTSRQAEREAHEKERSLLAAALRALKEVLGASEGNPGKSD